MVMLDIHSVYGNSMECASDCDCNCTVDGDCADESNG